MKLFKILLSALFLGGLSAVPAFAAKEPPDIEHQTFREHIACLFEKDG